MLTFKYCSALSTKASSQVILPFLCKQFCSETGAQAAECATPEINEGQKYVDRVVDEETLEKLRDVSRLPSMYRNRMAHILEPDSSETHPEYYESLFQKPKLKKFLFAHYGKKSGINPGVLWPSEADLKDIMEFEEQYEKPLQEKMKIAREERENDLKEKLEKEKLISSRLSKMSKYTEEFVEKINQMKEEENNLQKKRQDLLNMARDHFGYNIHQSDPRFTEFKERKIEEEKAKRKQMKTEEKKAKQENKRAMAEGNK